MKNLKTNTALFGSIKAKDANGLHLQDDGGNGMFIKDGGNVGIGTTNPGAQLHILGGDSDVRDLTLQYSGTSASAEQNIVWKDFRGQVNASIGNVLNGDGLNAPAGSINFRVGDGTSTLRDAMHIKANGNVGIGTANPNAKLEIEKDSYGTLSAGAGHIVLDTIGVAREKDKGPFINFRVPTSNTSSEDMANIGAVCSDSTASSRKADLVFWTRDTAFNERMRIKSAGNVGIGTTDPGVHRLDVEDDQAQFVQRIGNTRLSAAYGLYVEFTNNIDNTTSEYIRCSTNGNNNINFRVYSNGTIFADGTNLGSDDRIKHNEEKIVNAVEVLSKITPKKYFKTTKLYDADHNFDLDSDGNPVDENGEPVDHRVEAGVIAQEVLGVDELKFTVSPEAKNEDGDVVTPYSLNYNSLFTYAIAAIQEQQSIIEDLKSQNESLVARIEALEG